MPTYLPFSKLFEAIRPIINFPHIFSNQNCVISKHCTPGHLILNYFCKFIHYYRERIKPNIDAHTYFDIFCFSSHTLNTIVRESSNINYLVSNKYVRFWDFLPINAHHFKTSLGTLSRRARLK